MKKYVYLLKSDNNLFAYSSEKVAKTIRGPLSEKFGVEFELIKVQLDKDLSLIYEEFSKTKEE